MLKFKEKRGYSIKNYVFILRSARRSDLRARQLDGTWAQASAGAFQPLRIIRVGRDLRVHVGARANDRRTYGKTLKFTDYLLRMGERGVGLAGLCSL